MYRNSVLRDEAVNPIWQEEGGRLAIAIDSVPLKGIPTKALSFKGIWDEWVAEPTSLRTTGYRWGGPELRWNPGGGILGYCFHIRTAGKYRLVLRSRQDKGATCFVRTDGGTWAITQAGTDGSWSWETRRETGVDSREPFHEILDEGFHLIEISGREHGFCIERLAWVIDSENPDLDALPLSQRRPR
jgi:hypothetical protein